MAPVVGDLWSLVPGVDELCFLALEVVEKSTMAHVVEEL